MQNTTSFKDLNLSNAYLFAATLADDEICKLVLETCLDKKLPDLTVAHTEHAILLNSNFRSVRFDVYAKDKVGASYDLEMQNKNTKELGLRSRFYQGQIDIQSMQPGDLFTKLQPSYVIFICNFDPFEAGLYKYTICSRCDETGESIDDGALRIFLNTKGTAGEVSEELKDLLKYIRKSTEEVVHDLDEHSPIHIIHRRVTEVKNNAKLEGAFMTGQEWLDEQLEERLEAEYEEWKEKVRGELETEVREEVKTEVREEVKTEVREEVKTEVREEVKTEVREEVKTEVREEVRSEIQTELLQLLQSGASKEELESYMNK